MIERSLVLIKPDGVQRGLIGEITKRFENAGFKIVGLKMTTPSIEHTKNHYFDVAERRGQDIFMRNVEFLTSGPVISIVLEGVDAIQNIRKLVGDTESKSALPGTIRGDFSHVSYSHADDKKTVIKNVIHASSSKEDAKREIDLWFSNKELFNYKTVHELHTL